MTQGFDIIPDIHADADRLARTLTGLGYQRRGAGWGSPPGRMAAFLGDFIDMGRSNRAVLTQVRAMVEDGVAVAIMGNHELNALLYHRRGENSDATGDGYMRAHSAKNTAQHRTFLDEYPLGQRETEAMVAWFLTLPLFVDLGGVRLVHACWDDARLAAIRERRPDGLLAADDLPEIARGEGAGRFAEAVLTTLKGPEAELPPPHCFHDIKGHRRTGLRLQWWRADATTWRDAAMSVPDRQSLPATPIEGAVAFRPYGAAEKPVFFGHYKRLGMPVIDAPNAVCLDLIDVLCAYRWSGEQILDPAHLVVLGTPNGGGGGL